MKHNKILTAIYLLTATTTAHSAIFATLYKPDTSGVYVNWLDNTSVRIPKSSMLSLPLEPIYKKPCILSEKDRENIVKLAYSKTGVTISNTDLRNCVLDIEQSAVKYKVNTTNYKGSLSLYGNNLKGVTVVAGKNMNDITVSGGSTENTFFKSRFLDTTNKLNTLILMNSAAGLWNGISLWNIPSKELYLNKLIDARTIRLDNTNIANNLPASINSETTSVATLNDYYKKMHYNFVSITDSTITDLFISNTDMLNTGNYYGTTVYGLFKTNVSTYMERVIIKGVKQYWPEDKAANLPKYPKHFQSTFVVNGKQPFMVVGGYIYKSDLMQFVRYNVSDGLRISPASYLHTGTPVTNWTYNCVGIVSPIPTPYVEFMPSVGKVDVQYSGAKAVAKSNDVASIIKINNEKINCPKSISGTRDSQIAGNILYTFDYKGLMNKTNDLVSKGVIK